jgi:hypothetical protein
MEEGKMKLKLIKASTVLIRRPCWNKKAGVLRLIPLISFGGVELNAYGFEVGRRFEIYGQEGRLVLKAKEFKYENPIIKKEVNK